MCGKITVGGTDMRNIIAGRVGIEYVMRHLGIILVCVWEF